MKFQVIDNFSKKAQNYNQDARIQKESATQLLRYLDSFIKHLPDGKILEIGCGTGFVTQGLIKRFPSTPLTITDLSPIMLDFCQQNTRNVVVEENPPNFAILDGESFFEENKYALIISGLTFQWFLQPEITLLNLIKGLRPKGLLLFSFLTSNSFHEWKEICAELDIPYTGNQTLNIHHITNQNKLPPHVLQYWEESIPVYFKKSLDFFKSLKQIGTGTSIGSHRLQPHQMRLLLNHWDKKSPEQVQVTYKIVYCAMKLI